MLEHPRTIDVECKQSKCTKCGERVVDISQSRLVAVVASVAVMNLDGTDTAVS